MTCFDDELTEYDKFILEYSVRAWRFLRALSLGSHEWAISVTLLLRGGPFSEASLASLVGVPRTTLMPHTAKVIRLGIAEKLPGEGVQLTTAGRRLITRLAQELVQVVEGHQQGLTEETAQLLVDTFYKNGHRKGAPSTQELRLLAFPKMTQPFK